MVLILAVAAALVAVGVLLLLVRTTERRPPLRLPRESLLEERGDELYDAHGPRPRVPVDRDAPALDTDGAPSPRALPHGGPPPMPPRRIPKVIDHDPDEGRPSGPGATP
ncbi:hypothetical protein [Methylobacterium sp. JK268]